MNEAMGPDWQGRLVRAVVTSLPFLYGLLWGCIVAVFIGAVAGGGPILLGFIGALTTLTGAGLGIWGSRWVSQQNAERERQRGAYEDYLRLQTGIRALMTFRDAVTVVAQKPGATRAEKIAAASPEERGNMTTAIISVACAGFDDPPSFKDCIRSDEDHAKAHRIRYYFAAAHHLFRGLEDFDLFGGKVAILVAQYLDPIALENAQAFERELLVAGGYFREKLRITK